ncbi:MAG: WG repeat-containing protein, partial [Saprospiraceae bacterium]
MKIQLTLIVAFLPFFIFAQESNLLPRPQDSQYGYLDKTTNELIIPYQFDMAGHFKDGIAMVKKEGLWGIIREDGTFVLPIEYLVISNQSKINDYGNINFRGSNIFVKKDGKWGLLNNKFESILPIEYDDLKLLHPHEPFKTSKNQSHYFSTNSSSLKMYAALKEGKWGVVDESLKTVFPFEYDGIELVTNFDYTGKNNQFFNKVTNQSIANLSSEGCSEITFQEVGQTFLIEKNGKTQIIQPDQTITISETNLHDATFSFSSLDDPNTGIFYLKKDNKTGAINTDGKIVLPFEYDQVNHLKLNFFLISKANKFGIIDSKCEIIQSPIFHKIYNNIFTLDGKTGTLNFNFTKQLISPQYEKLIPFYRGNRNHHFGSLKKGTLFAIKNGQYGLIDSLNNIIIPFQDKELSRLDDETILAKLDKKQSLLDTKGNLILPSNLDYLNRNNRNKNEVIVSKDGLVGIYNISKKKFSVDPIYELIVSSPNQKYFNIAKKNDKYGIIDNEGKTLLPFEYDKISGSKIQKNDKWGYLDDDGKIWLEPKYDKIRNQFVVQENGFWGILDSIGNWDLLPKYDRIDGYGLECQIYLDNKIGLFNRKTKTLIKPIYEELRRQGQFYVAKKNKLYGILNQADEIILPFKYDKIEGRFQKFIVQKDLKWGIFNEQGKQLQPFIFSAIGERNKNLPNDLVPVFQNKKMGLVNKEGELIIPCLYSEVRSNKTTSFHFAPHNIYPARKNKKWGYVAKGGKEIVPFDLNRADPFYFGIAVVCNNGLMQVIDTLGKVVTTKNYENITHIQRDSFYRIKENGKYGLINHKGVEVISPSYDWLDFKNHLTGIVAQKNNKYGVINKKGEIIIPFNLENKPQRQMNGILFLEEANPVT